MDFKFHRCKRKAQDFHLLSFLYLVNLFTFRYPLHSVQIDIQTFIHAERTKERQRYSISNGRHQFPQEE